MECNYIVKSVGVMIWNCGGWRADYGECGECGGWKGKDI